MKNVAKRIKNRIEKKQDYLARDIKELTAEYTKTRQLLEKLIRQLGINVDR